jgi:hypothetical protein
MSLFDLSLEEDKSMVTSGVEGDYEEPEEVHPEAAGAEGEQIEHLSRVLNTIDSLESARVTYMNMKQNETEYSAESMRTINQVLSERITMAYQMNGLKEEFPVHISTESFSTLHGSRNAITLALEELDGRILGLSTEANGFFDRFWRNTKEFFGREFNRIERIKDDITKLINDIEKTDDSNSANSFVVKNGSALTIDGKLAIDKVVTNVVEGVKNQFGNGRFMEDYFSELEQACHFFDKANWSDAQGVANAMERKNFFKLGAPFKEIPARNGKFNNYEWKISDLNSMVIPMPKGSESLIPSHPYSDSNKIRREHSGNAAAKTSADKNLPYVGKQQLLKSLNTFLNCLNDLPDASQFNSLTSNMKKRIAQLVKLSIPLKNHQKDSTDWNSEDWKALAGGIILPAAAFIILGGPGLIGLVSVRSTATFGNFVQHLMSSDAKQNINRNTTQEADGFIRGGVFGIGYSVINGLFLKKYTNSFENKVTLFFIGAYRELYTVIKSTANALLSYGYASIGQSNKY